MKITIKFFKIAAFFLAVISALIFCAIAIADSTTEKSYKVIGNNELSLESKIPIKVKRCDNVSVDGKVNNVGVNYEVELKVFGIVPVKRANVEVVDEMSVLVLGTPFGMKIYTDGVLIIDISDVDSANGYVKPAKECGLQIGDFIISINGQQVFTNENVAQIIEESGGEPLKFIIKRDGVIKNITLTPVRSSSTGVYKAGIWVRDSSAGIGTLTFYCPTNNVLCGLGHSVSDSDTGKTLTVNKGEIVAAEIVSFTRGEQGSPGELHGRLLSTKYANFNLNCNSGVYGVCDRTITTGDMLQVALKQEIKNGQAYILSTINGDTPKKYKCNVTIIKASSETQNLLIEVTDKELLSLTGGILQGMSGSPIIQNGKLIGAVTHVLIDDSSKGYGIFAENMLATAQSVGEGSPLPQNSQQLKDAS